MLSESGLLVVIEPALEEDVLRGGVGMTTWPGAVGLEKAEVGAGESE